MEMDSESRVPHTELRHQRELRGWSQKRLADAIDTSKEMVSRWERGEQNPGKHYQEKLCELFGKSAQELGFIREPNQPSSLSHDNSNQKSPENNNLQGTDRLIVRKLTRLQNWIVDSLEDGTRLRWQFYYTSSNSLTEDGLLSQIARLEQLADDGGDHSQRMCRILAQNYQLAGSLARDRFQYAKSIDYFQKAEQLDADIQLPDLTATAIARQAVALLRKDQKRYLTLCASC
jgi:transcriptional regulator with XRE-family HTH domain